MADSDRRRLCAEPDGGTFAGADAVADAVADDVTDIEANDVADVVADVEANDVADTCANAATDAGAYQEPDACPFAIATEQAREAQIEAGDSCSLDVAFRASHCDAADPVSAAQPLSSVGAPHVQLSGKVDLEVYPKKAHASPEEGATAVVGSHALRRRHGGHRAARESQR